MDEHKHLTLFLNNPVWLVLGLFTSPSNVLQYALYGSAMGSWHGVTEGVPCYIVIR